LQNNFASRDSGQKFGRASKVGLQWRPRARRGCVRFEVALGHVAWAIANFVTIIGIPFGIQHLKLAGIALAPIGKTVVTKEVAAAARAAAATATVAELRKGS
jgi:hypothetical protein